MEFGLRPAARSRPNLSDLDLLFGAALSDVHWRVGTRPIVPLSGTEWVTSWRGTIVHILTTSCWNT